MADIILTLPCPLCPSPGTMLRAIYDPGDGYPDRPILAEVSGCSHAQEAMADLNGLPNPMPEGLKSSPQGYTALWEALGREVENYLLDCYTDQLEASSKYRRLREED